MKWVPRVTDEGLVLEWPKTGEKGRALPYMWLRDNCRCSECVNQDTMQRNFNTFAIPTDIKPKIWHKSAATGHLYITWSDGHESRYGTSFLAFYSQNDRRSKEILATSYWHGSMPIKSPLKVTYDQVMASEAGVKTMTQFIRRFGYVFVTGTPYDDPNKTKELLERIAFIRITHYGGFYDFTPDLAMADTAYTNLALPAHTDTTYFSDPAGLQAFHMLSHTPAPSDDKNAEQGAAAEGGKSLLVDGFLAAKTLKSEDPKAYDVLASVRLHWHASGNKGITIAPDQLYPVLELDSYSGELRRIRWNNDDRGVVPFGEKYSPTEWYDAARKWDAILRRKDIEAWVQLEPGTVLIFDNWRVLHGRSAFTGIRRMCGGYINRDDFISRWRNLNTPQKSREAVVIG